MMRRFIAAAAIASAGLCAPALAQQTAQTQQTTSSESETVPLSDIAYGVRGLLDTPVVNPEGETLGKVRDVILSKAGRPMAIIISTKGNGGSGKLVAVPFHAVDHKGDDTVLLAMTRQELDDRPAFDYADARVPRDLYLADWSARLDEAAREAKARGKDAALAAGDELGVKWKDVQNTWNDVKSATAENWDRTTNAFENAFDAFKRSWDSSETQGQ